MKKLNIVTSNYKNTKTYSIKDLKSYNPTKAEEIYWLNVFELYINDFIKTVFGDIPKINVRVNKRISTTQAQFCFSSNRRCHIEVSSRLIKLCSMLECEQVVLKGVEGILKHEAIHYVLYYLNKPYDDGTHIFETLIAETRSMPSGATPSYKKVKGSTVASLNFGFEQVCPKCSKSTLTSTGGNRYYCPPCSDVNHSKYVMLKKEGLQIKVHRNVKYGSIDGSPAAYSLIKGDCKKIKPLSRFLK